MACIQSSCRRQNHRTSPWVNWGPHPCLPRRNVWGSYSAAVTEHGLKQRAQSLSPECWRGMLLYWMWLRTRPWYLHKNWRNQAIAYLMLCGRSEMGDVCRNASDVYLNKERKILPGICCCSDHSSSCEVQEPLMQVDLAPQLDLWSLLNGTQHWRKFKCYNRNMNLSISSF